LLGIEQNVVAGGMQREVEGEGDVEGRKEESLWN
jgi:hypothetical protein